MGVKVGLGDEPEKKVPIPGKETPPPHYTEMEANVKEEKNSETRRLGRRERLCFALLGFLVFSLLISTIALSVFVCRYKTQLARLEAKSEKDHMMEENEIGNLKEFADVLRPCSGGITIQTVCIKRKLISHQWHIIRDQRRPNRRGSRH